MDFVAFFCNSQRQRGSINQPTNAKTFGEPFQNLCRATFGTRAAGWTPLNQPVKELNHRYLEIAK